MMLFKMVPVELLKFFPVVKNVSMSDVFENMAVKPSKDEL
jgi:hypothetical protein